ncbi:alpha/beta hydrolase [Filimonas effusa]|uniref:Alpha/beta hydrolase n=1 Tax=Filimonas effusa TaxID=2508721 RepID=A0A4Q1D5L7_9BACT|nr:alpha/beta hydrolase-fold protein [Filimonas effusa]RXK82951.1 alpha/beta hydrolase [Filimonas effusa]
MDFYLLRLFNIKRMLWGIGILSCLLVPAKAYCQTVGDSVISIGKAYHLYSGELKENRSYWVYLPQHYNDPRYPTQRYPVLYLLDGDVNFHSLTGMLQFLSKGAYAQLPEMIVVGILNTDRTRDLTPTYANVKAMNGISASFESSGGAEGFISFLKNEMMPLIDSSYRTMGYRILTGHSFGGLAAVNILLHHPGMFHSYLAIDPSLWWDNEYMLRRADSLFRDENRFKGRQLFMSLAFKEHSEIDTTTDQERAIRTFAAKLKRNAPVGLRWNFAYYESEDHGSVPLRSELEGLRFLFKGYQAEVKQLLQKPELLEAGYKELSVQLGYTFLPPEYLVDWIASFCEKNGKYSSAKYLLEMNVRNYPESKGAAERLHNVVQKRFSRAEGRYQSRRGEFLR